MPVRAWNGRHLIRVSIALYNEQSDLDLLVEALAKVIAERAPAEE